MIPLIDVYQCVWQLTFVSDIKSVQFMLLIESLNLSLAFKNFLLTSSFLWKMHFFQLERADEYIYTNHYYFLLLLLLLYDKVFYNCVTLLLILTWRWFLNLIIYRKLFFFFFFFLEKWDGGRKDRNRWPKLFTVVPFFFFIARNRMLFFIFL